MAPTGYYRMHRGWMDNPTLADRQPYSRREAWCWLIENAAWRPHRWRVAGRSISVSRGQLVASVRHMAAAWRWTPAKVQRFLCDLKTDTMVDTVADTGVTVVTICNYEIYQTDDEEVDTPRDTTSDTPAIQTEERKEDKKEDISDSSLRSESGALAAPLSHDDPKKSIFSDHLPWLVQASGKSETSVRTFLGKCCKEYGDAKTLAACVQIRDGPGSLPVNPFSAMKAILLEQPNGRHRKVSISDLSASEIRDAMVRGSGLDLDGGDAGFGRDIREAAIGHRAS